jgi:TolB protein
MKTGGGSMCMNKVRPHAVSVVALLAVLTSATHAQGHTELIAFQSNRHGSLDIFVMATDGSEVRRLSELRAADHSPTISPDGTRIAFVSDREGISSVFVMGMNGDDQRRVTDGSDEEDEPSWSSDGTSLYFRRHRGSGPEVWVVDVESGSLEQVTDGHVSFKLPTVSPDGSELLANVSKEDAMEIWVLDIVGGGTQLVQSPTDWSMMPRWSPDGTEIVYASAEGPPFLGGSVELHLIGADGLNDRAVTSAGTVSEYPCWSPTGRRIAFQGYRDGDFEIFVMNVDGSAITQLTDNDAFDGRPSWGRTSRR